MAQRLGSLTPHEGAENQPIIVGVLLVSAGGAWAAFVGAPSDAEQCTHLAALLDKKLPGFSTSPPGKDFQASGPEKVRRGQLESQLGYAKRAKCVVAAESFDAVEACDTRKIRYGSREGVPASPDDASTCTSTSARVQGPEQ